MSTSVILMVILLAGAVGAALLLMRQQTGLYQNPALHEGRWGRPLVHGQGDMMRVTWECEGGYHICTGGNHGAARCTIGPGMAHLDECMCGATRSGVFGRWMSSAS